MIYVIYSHCYIEIMIAFQRDWIAFYISNKVVKKIEHSVLFRECEMKYLFLIMLPVILFGGVEERERLKESHALVMESLKEQLSAKECFSTQRFEEEITVEEKAVLIDRGNEAYRKRARAVTQLDKQVLRPNNAPSIFEDSLEDSAPSDFAVLIQYGKKQLRKPQDAPSDFELLIRKSRDQIRENAQKYSKQV